MPKVGAKATTPPRSGEVIAFPNTAELREARERAEWDAQIAVIAAQIAAHRLRLEARIIAFRAPDAPLPPGKPPKMPRIPLANMPPTRRKPGGPTVVPPMDGPDAA